MPDPVAGAAGCALRERLHQVMLAIRLVKQHQLALRVPVPAGMISVLGAIDRIGDEQSASGGCHVKDLAARNALDPSTVSRAVTALVRHGLVRRTADPSDGRASVLELTDQGRADLRDSHYCYDSLLTEALAGWSEQDLATFGTLLHRFADDVLIRLGAGTETPTPLHTPLEAAR